MPPEPAIDPAASFEGFIAELKRWRDVRGISQSTLARRTGYSPSYVSKVEGGAQPPSRTFAKKADDELRAGGALTRAFPGPVAIRAFRCAVPTSSSPELAATEPGPVASLVVEHDDAELVYDGQLYRATQRRLLFNDGHEPVSRYLIRISVDRYPGDPERSNQLYREHPLSWKEIGLQAWHGEDREPMDWKVQHDRDAFKELWLLFENGHGRFPLYPGERTWIEYSYTVDDQKWGQWYQRAVRLPTRCLSVRLVFPAELDPVVWGMETSMSAAAAPFRTAITRQEDGPRRIFSWSIEEPPLHARYRIEWRFRTRPEDDGDGPAGTLTPSDTMRNLGIVQRGADILATATRPFNLPAEADDARRVLAELRLTMERVAQAHYFSKGMGIAAPQIGISRASAIIRPPDRDDIITLLNPRIIEESAQVDEQYEGCLSFFDVRGVVPRPLAIHVEHQDLDGHQRITLFERGTARLVAHEIDHLNGILYTERMRAGAESVPVAQYPGTGSPWRY